jgi:hypothetical protein
MVVMEERVGVAGGGTTEQQGSRNRKPLHNVTSPRTPSHF